MSDECEINEHHETELELSQESLISRLESGIESLRAENEALRDGIRALADRMESGAEPILEDVVVVGDELRALLGEKP
jgi:FtsZ-binding cell division protein ZapB